MSMKNLMCRPCWFWLIFILHFYGNFLFLSQLIVKSSGEVKYTSLRLIWRSQIKPLETLLFCLLLHLFYQKSPSSKSRIRVYLLLVDRNPTTTTHKLIIGYSGICHLQLRPAYYLRLHPTQRLVIIYHSKCIIYVTRVNPSSLSSWKV